jgi:CheY-like chemotaxis protein
MTANAFAEDEAKCLAVGMNGFVAKPVDPQGLCEIICRCLEQRDDLAARAAQTSEGTNPRARDAHVPQEPPGS